MPSMLSHQHKLDELEQQYALLNEKIRRLRTAHVIESGAAERFELEKQIEMAEADRERIEQQMDALSQTAPPEQSRIRIYISSTYSDLVDYRQQVCDLLHQRRYDVVALQDHVATDERSLDKALADLSACHIYVGIFAWRYGYIPPGHDQSITELEYRHAGDLGLSRLIFLLDENAPWPRSQMEMGAGGARIEALRAELAASHEVRFFQDAQDLAQQVDSLVAEWAQARLEAGIELLRTKQTLADKQRREIRSRRRVVNVCPLDITHTFKDRDREIEVIREHLAAENVRLIGVIGRGGMGKTALASRVIVDLEQGKLLVSEEGAEVDVDGILYLSTRSTGLSLERIYNDIGRMLGEPVASTLAARWADREILLPAKVEYLLETMQDGVYLLLLDNLEDELAEDGSIEKEGLRLFVEYCLTQRSGARLIVTSREHVKVAAAALPWIRNVPLREGLPEEDAIALLREFDPEGALGLRDAPEEDLRRAARLTRGIPRALEILAGILYGDPTTSLSKLLADRTIFGAEVMEKLVAEGYRRLEEDERRVMEALSIFDRPVDETAIAYLLHPWSPGLNVRTYLRRLANSHFVGVNRDTGEYGLHPLDREYAYQQIPAPPDRQPVGQEQAEQPPPYNQRSLELRAADFYRSVRKPESEWKSLTDLAPQLAEFEHLVRAGYDDRAGQVLDQIDADYLFRWSYYSRLAELREKLLGNLTRPELQVSNLDSLANVYRLTGRIEEGIALYEQALEIARESGDRLGEGRVLGHLGNVYHTSGQVEEGIALYEAALAIAREHDDRRKIGIELSHLGLAYATLGQGQRAIEYHQQALEIAQEVGDRRQEGLLHGHLGSVNRDMGHADQAIPFYEQALDIVRQIGDRRAESFQLGRMGRGYYKLLQFDQALKFLEEALAVAQEINSRRQECIWLGHLGLVHYARGDVAQALELCQAGLAIARETNDRREVGLDLGRLANVYRDQGRTRQAFEAYQGALDIACEVGDRRKMGDWLGGVGRARHDLGQFEAAAQLYEAALTIAREVGDRQGEGIWYDYLGDVHFDQREWDRAIEMYRASLDLTREVKNHRGVSFPLLGLGRAWLAAGDLEEARRRCEDASALDVPGTGHRAALALAIVMLRQRASDVDAAFAEAVDRCRAVLARAPSLYKARHALATALVGQAVCDPRWAEMTAPARADLLAPALEAYRQGLAACSAPGVVRAVLHDVEMMRAAGVDGLGEVVELLTPETQPAPDPAPIDLSTALSEAGCAR